MIRLTLKEADELAEAFKVLFNTSKLPNSKARELKKTYYSFTTKIIELESSIVNGEHRRFNNLLKKLNKESF